MCARRTNKGEAGRPRRGTVQKKHTSHGKKRMENGGGLSRMGEGGVWPDKTLKEKK